MTLLIRVDRAIREARAQFNQNWFRRLMRVPQFAVKRLRRRWATVDPPPLLQLGQLRRRYHANVAKYLKVGYVEGATRDFVGGRCTCRRC